MQRKRERSGGDGVSTQARLEAVEREAQRSKQFRESVKTVLGMSPDTVTPGTYGNLIGSRIEVRLASGEKREGILLSEHKFQITIRWGERELIINKGRIETVTPLRGG